ncbi:plant cysteine oxidase 2 [Prunus yedoensis var. nudiflora]|uniref:cysteine dioxygenase n=1 Tax=Prunus yedoensis var. nudiflora TaxID=2094558 RepID=A0A314YKR7_PRUYE|nr:plant cysteine oxidase 2 [Prunus yedoensis var. nudiflora]
MGIETTTPNRKGNKEIYGLPVETNSHSKTRKCRRRHRKMSPVQSLYQTCKDVFSYCGAGIVPSPEDIQRLRSVLDTMKPADVGLTPELPYFRMTVARRTPAITYLHLHECEKFSVTTPPGVRLAKVKVDADFTAPCDTSILYPADGGNMHCFTAVTACAVLDVLGPPYSDPDGRHCQYYLDFPFSHFSVDGLSVAEEEKEGYAWLQEIEKPGDLAVDGAMYRGPKIVEN